MKPVIFTRHARQRLVERGTAEEEVVGAIREAPWTQADKRRHVATKWFPFGREHEGAFYADKDVRPVFVIEGERFVVVTAYVYFNQRAEP